MNLAICSLHDFFFLFLADSLNRNSFFMLVPNRYDSDIFFININHLAVSLHHCNTWDTYTLWLQIAGLNINIRERFIESSDNVDNTNNNNSDNVSRHSP